jgi:hypothetical protein
MSWDKRSRDEIEKQLGMKESMAQARLKKRIMFWLAQRLGEDNCYKCKKKIERAEDLSIEHKVEWLHRSPELFWDLNNIAFSHIPCNRPRSLKGTTTRRRIVSPEGQNWCKNCGFLSAESFYSKANRHNGKHHLCKTCTSDLSKKYYKENKSKINKRSSKYYKSNKEKIIAQVKQYAANNKKKIAARYKQYYLEVEKPRREEKKNK